MRIVGALLAVCFGVVVLTGCKNKKADEGGGTDPDALKAQQELIARRDKLIDARKKLQADRDKVDAEIKDIQSKGGDASEQIKKRAELDSQLETQTSDLISMVNSKLDAMAAGGDKSASMASREAEVASRERAVADRETRLAERERLIAQRDFESSQRWKDSCNTGAAPVIIQQAPPKAGDKYTAKDVTALIARAKQTMNKKGLINSDLPGPAQSLESDASSALNDNDISKAMFAANQLVAQVDSIVVNRQFIQAKMARISAQVKAAKVDEGTNKELAEILSDVMSRYNDGDFKAANARLNNLAAKLK